MTKCIYCNEPDNHPKLPSSFAPHARKLGLLPCDYVHDDASAQNDDPMTLGQRLRAALATADA